MQTVCYNSCRALNRSVIYQCVNVPSYRERRYAYVVAFTIRCKHVICVYYCICNSDGYRISCACICVDVTLVTVIRKCDFFVVNYAGDYKRIRIVSGAVI